MVYVPGIEKNEHFIIKSDLVLFEKFIGRSSYAIH